MRLRFSVLVTCLLLSFSSAWGETRVAVVPFASLDGGLPAQTGENAARLLARQLKQVGMRPAEVPLEQNLAAQAALQRARALVVEAEQRAAGRRFAAAAERYREAVAGFEQAAPLLSAPLELLEAQTSLAISLHLSGNQAQGASALEQALVLAPDGPLPEERTSALFSRSVESTRARLRALAPGSVRFDSVPAGVVVELDGRKLGNTPLVVQGVPAGRHLWRMLLPTSAPAGGLVAVTPGGRARVQASLSGDSPASRSIAGLAANRIDSTLVSDLAAAAEGCEAVVFGGVSRDPSGVALHPFLFLPSTGRLTRLPRLSFDVDLLAAGMPLYALAGEVKARVAASLKEPSAATSASEPLPTAVSLDPAPAPRAVTEVPYAATPAPAEEPGPAGPRRPINPYSTVRELRPRERGAAR